MRRLFFLMVLSLFTLTGWFMSMPSASAQSLSATDLALLSAARAGRPDLVQTALTSQAHVNARDTTPPHMTALMYAASSGNDDCVRLLLQNSNTQVSSVDDRGNTALIYAAYARTGRSDLVIARLLRNSNVQVSAINKLGQTALMGAARVGNAEAVRLLLANPNTQASRVDLQGWTALHNAVLGDSEDAVKYLLANPNVQVNAQDRALLRTSLMLAAGSKAPHALAIVKRLLSNSNVQQKINLRDKEGTTAFAYAVGINNPDIISFLASKGATR